MAKTNRRSTTKHLCGAVLAALTLLHGGPVLSQGSTTNPTVDTNARKEGSLVIYTSSTTPEMDLITREFGKKYPEIKIEFIRQTSGVVFNRYLGEVELGVALVDVLYTGATALYEERPELFLELKPEEVPNLSRPRAVEANNRNYVVTGVTPHMVTYSSATVSQEDLKNHLKEWRQLSDPRWKGRIGLTDPRTSINSASFLNALREAYGDDWLKALGQNNMKMFESGTTAAQQAVAGALQLVIPTNYSQSAALRAQNAPVAVYAPLGPAHSQAQSLGVAKQARHPNAAFAFVNWELSDEGQAALCELQQVPVVVGISGSKCGKMPEGVILSNDLLSRQKRDEIESLIGLSK